jgi:hypothetical protein
LEASIFGTLMNTKGLVALVTANLGLSSGLITERLFTMAIVMILVNTFATAPSISLIYRLVKKQSLKKGYVNDGSGGSARVLLWLDDSVPGNAADALVQLAATLFAPAELHTRTAHAAESVSSSSSAAQASASHAQRERAFALFKLNTQSQNGVHDVASAVECMRVRI